jgi:hypothetical protein
VWSPHGGGASIADTTRRRREVPAVRYVIELRRTPDDRVEGHLIAEGAAAPAPFSGWMELICLLQPPPEPSQNGHLEGALRRPQTGGA